MSDSPGGVFELFVAKTMSYAVGFYHLFDVRTVGLLRCLLCLVEELCWIKSFNGTLIPHMSPPDHDWLKSILVIEHELEKFSW